MAPSMPVIYCSMYLQKDKLEHLPLPISQCYGLFLRTLVTPLHGIRPRHQEGRGADPMLLVFSSTAYFIDG